VYREIQQLKAEHEKLCLVQSPAYKLLTKEVLDILDYMKLVGNVYHQREIERELQAAERLKGTGDFYASLKHSMNAAGLPGIEGWLPAASGALFFSTDREPSEERFATRQTLNEAQQQFQNWCEALALVPDKE
jgi:hypothetical protein